MSQYHDEGELPTLDVATAMEATHGGMLAGALLLGASAFVVIALAYLVLA